MTDLAVIAIAQPPRFFVRDARQDMIQNGNRQAYCRDVSFPHLLHRRLHACHLKLPLSVEVVVTHILVGPARRCHRRAGSYSAAHSITRLSPAPETSIEPAALKASDRTGRE